MKISFISFLLILSMRPAFSLESESDIFSKSYTEDYQVLMCSHNMMTLIERFKEADLSLRDTFIMHVRALNAPFSEVNGYKGRSGKVQRWSFHAFMIRKGKVFDMDYEDSQRQPTLAEYLKEMFFPSINQRLLFQIKPASQYRGEDFDGSMNSSLYPLQELNEETVLNSLNAF